MTRAADQITYVAQVARIRIETAIVEIKADANSLEDAMSEAIEEADMLPQSVWKMAPFDASAYRPHVQSIVSQDEFEEELEAPVRNHDTTSVEGLVDARLQTRYLLLKADCDTAEGDVILQPWLVVDQPDLLASDLCRDWIAAIQSLGLTHMSERVDDLARGGEPRPSDCIVFGAKPPPKHEP